MRIKKLLIIGFAVMLLFVLTACGKINFSVHINEDNTASIEAVRAKEKAFGGAGSITVGENEKIVIESDLSGKSEINVKLIPMGGLGIDAAAEDLANRFNGGNTVLDVNVSGKAVTEYEIAPGDYTVSAAVVSKATGTIQIRTK